MAFANIKRILHPSLTYNERDTTYQIENLSRNEIKSLLSAPLAGGGVFGLEGHRVKEHESLVFFAPPQIKTGWIPAKRDRIFYEMPKYQESLIMQLYTEKISAFPLSMESPISLWEKIKEITPLDIGVMYQILLAYRQDNWKEKIEEQYEDYLSGIESPYESKVLRKIQRRVNESLDSFLQWEFHYPTIEEVEQKLEENGFRYSVRIIVYGGKRRDRLKIKEETFRILEEINYVNQWTMNSSFLFDDIIQDIKKRRIDNVGKQHVLSESEIIPLLATSSVIHVEGPTIVGKKEKKSNRVMDLLPLGKDIQQQDGKNIAKRMVDALKELGKIKEEIVVKRIQSGPTMTKIAFDLPKGLKLSELNKKNVIEDLQALTGEKGIRITQGEEIGEFDIWIEQEEQQKIFLRNYIDTNEFYRFSQEKPLPFFVGVDEIGKPIYKCLNAIRHILVAGTTGSGKSIWINQLILTLLLTKKPEELQFYMIDIKQVELPIYKDFPHVHSVITDANEGVRLLGRLIEEMNRRYELLKEAEVKNIGLYNQKRPEEKLPYLVCVIDEYAELALRNESVHDYVQSLAQLSRAAGIHLIISTQRPSVDVIPGIIKSNLPGKIGLYCSSGNSYLTFLNTKPPFQLLGKGDGTMSFEGQREEHIRFQGCLIIDDPHDKGLEGDLIKDIASRMEEYEKEDLPNIEEKESNMDKLKRIIAITGETRVASLREEMRININKLNELMKELVEEGWLQKPETKQSGYQLIAKKEELEKWRR